MMSSKKMGQHHLMIADPDTPKSHMPEQSVGSWKHPGLTTCGFPASILGLRSFHYLLPQETECPNLATSFTLTEWQGIRTLVYLGIPLDRTDSLSTNTLSNNILNF